MTIEKKQEGTKLTVLLEGKLDTITAPALETALEDIEGITELIIDMEFLTYISSVGLRVLLMVQKKLNKQGSSMVIRGANEMLREIFDVTKFSSIITVE